MALLTSTSSDLVAYFDESIESGPKMPIIAVAGYLFEPHQYIAFDEGMRAMLREHGICYFRMSECDNEIGQFKKLKGSGRDEQAERQVIRLIREHALIGVACGVSEANFRLLQPAHTEVVLGGPYSMLCQWCLAELGLWADRNGFNREIAYFFEAGFKDQDEASAAMEKIVLYPDLKKRYRYGSHTFVPKMRMRGLQAADLLAWFERRESEAIAGIRPFGKERRKDWQTLIGCTNEELKLIEHRFKYFDIETLKTHFAENSDPSMRWWS